MVLGSNFGLSMKPILALVVIQGFRFGFDFSTRMILWAKTIVKGAKLLHRNEKSRMLHISLHSTHKFYSNVAECEIHLKIRTIVASCGK